MALLERTGIAELGKIFQAQRYMIIGVGNRLAQDDGVGSFLAEELSLLVGKDRVIDAGLMIENYIFSLEKTTPDVVIVIDSVEFGKEPGAIGIFSLDEFRGVAISSHSLSLSQLKGIFEIMGIKEIIVIGIQPQKLQAGEGLSPRVMRAKENLKRTLVSLMRGEEIGDC